MAIRWRSALIFPVGVTVIALAASAAIAAGFPGLTAEEARKLDPWLAVAAEPWHRPDAAGARQALGPAAIAAGVELRDGGAFVPLLIQVAGGDTRGLAALGIRVDTVAGEVATARNVPLSRIADLARRPEVVSIQAARRLLPLNDVSVPETRAPQVWADPDFGFTGQGVIIGIIDTGIDVNHPDFHHLDGSTRIELLLDLSQPGSGPFGGTLFTANQIDAGITAPDRVGHGTHVAGTAAGGGMADSTFRGVAFEADLVIVNADRTSTGSFIETDIVNSLAFVDSVAIARGQPYVANLSLGGHNGAHDGSGLQELAIDFLVRPGKAGSAIVVAAGNERSGPPRHAAAEVMPDDLPDGIQLGFQLADYTPMPGEFNDIVVINLWYEAFSAFAITIETPNGFTVGPFAPGQTNAETGTDTEDGLVAVINAVNGSNPQNGDYEASVFLVDAPTPATPGNWTIHVAGATGPLDAYVAFSSMSVRFLSPYAATEGFIGEPGSGRNAITVGSYTTKISWEDKDGNPHAVLGAVIGDISSFSNAGPTRDGRIKPELCAPGQLIASCYSADAPPGSAASIYTSPFPQFPNFFILAGDRYAIQQGTSQATPHVTGAVALLFQQHPEWDTLDVKRALAGTARADAFTGPVPNNLFGNGKLDIFAAVSDPGTLPPGDVDGDNDVDLTDVSLAIDFVLQRATPSAAEAERTDMNADRVLDVADLVLIVAELVGDPGAAAEPELAADGRTWLLPLAIDAGRPVVGVELELECETPGCEPLAGAVRAARAGVLALAAPNEGRPAWLRVVALTLDEQGLAGPAPVILLPFRTSPEAGGTEPTWRLTGLRLVGRGGEPVQGKALLGPAERLLPPSLRVLPIAANPSASPGPIAFDLPGGSARDVAVGIYDVSGRLVARLAEGMRVPGRHVVHWDGMGANGRRLAAGVYWVRVVAGDEIAGARLTLLR